MFNSTSLVPMPIKIAFSIVSNKSYFSECCRGGIFWDFSDVVNWLLKNQKLLKFLLWDLVQVKHIFVRVDCLDYIGAFLPNKQHIQPRPKIKMLL